MGLNPTEPPKSLCENIKAVNVDDKKVVISACNKIVTNSGKILFFQTINYEVNSEGSLKVSTEILPNKHLHRLISLPRIGFIVSGLLNI